MTETIEHADGRIELQLETLQSIKTSPLYNEDLAPVQVPSGIFNNSIALLCLC